jgi:hypothetical protein
MLQFHADRFLRTVTLLSAIEARLRSENRDSIPRVAVLKAVREEVANLLRDGIMYDFKSVVSQCERIQDRINDPFAVPFRTIGDLREELKSLRIRWEDEFKSQFLLHLDLNQAKKYNDPLKDWKQTADRFGKVRWNIEESSKCFALERYGAAVFHILLVAEFGVITLAKLLQVEGDKPGWGALDRLRRILQKPYSERNELEQLHSKLLENTVPLAFVVKDSWRHKLTHVDNQIIWNESDFTERTAEEIITATRGFMRKLAMDLPALG